MLSILTMPDASAFVSSSSQWATGLSSDSLLVAAILVGLSVVFLLASGIMGKIIGGVGRLTGRGRRGGGRRRR